MLVFDTTSGKTVAGIETGGDADDMSFDPAGKRIYLACGDGVITTIQQLDALDRQPATLEVATKLSTGYPEIYYREADILEWDSVESYDIVLCTLALHHFSDEDAVTVLRRCRELSRKFVLVSDLRRGLLATAGVYLLTALIFREPMTRYDARLSAERAFSFSEMRKLAMGAGWQNFGHRRCRVGRQAIWLE